MRRRRGFVLLTLAALGFAWGVGAILWDAVQATSVETLHAQIAQLKPLLTVTRVSLIGLVALMWPVAVGLLQRWRRIDAASARRVHGLRWRVVMWLLVIELLLGQQLVVRFFAAVQGFAP